MKLFFSFLKSIKNGIAAFFVFSVIFFVSFFLFRLPVEAVLYPAVLCLLVGIFFVAAGYIKFRKKHTELERIKNLTAALITRLPEPDSLTEKDCFDIIKKLKAENVEAEAAFNSEYLDMTEYYSVWAHQIKTPIASMKLTLENEDSAFSRKISSDLLRIEQYVEMVLAFLRLDSPSTDYVFARYSLDGIIKQSVKKFARDFIGKKISLEYSETGVSFTTDEKWFSFVIEQILSNAVKYTNSGNIGIYVDKKCVCISDTGIGIAPEDLPRIFEKGYTGFNGRQDKSASGIGLYLCKRICKNLGVGISAKSEVGKGTVITLDLSECDFEIE